MRIYIILLSFLFVASASDVFGQGPPPPPAPLIYSAPTETDISVYSEPSGLFKASFPGQPKEEKKESEEYSEKSYSVTRKGSMSRISVVVFTNSVESKATEIINNLRSNIAGITRNPPKEITENPGKITIDTKQEINGKTWHIIGYETNHFFTHIAFYIKGDRLFVINTDVTNWHILKNHHPKIVSDFNTEAERFLRSVIIP